MTRKISTITPHTAERNATASGEFTYLVHFLRGVALTAHDRELTDAVTQLEHGHPPAVVARVGDLLAARLAAAC